MTEDLKAKEPIVLDAEGGVVHDPFRADPNTHQKAAFKVFNLNQVGLIPKVLIGVVFVALLFVGLTVAGIALGVFVVTFLARSIFRPRGK